MSVITTFLQSDQALKILGLPGLALLLAFVFYRTLKLKRLSRGFGFMRLLRVVGDKAEFSTWWDDRETHTVKLA